MSMRPAPVSMSALSGRAIPLHRVYVPSRLVSQASVREREPIGERVTTGSKSSTDPKDLLQDLQRLREQRARLRAELTSKEQNLRSRAVEAAPPPQQDGDTHVDGPIDSGNDSTQKSPESACPARSTLWQL